MRKLKKSRLKTPVRHQIFNMSSPQACCCKKCMKKKVPLCGLLESRRLLNV